MDKVQVLDLVKACYVDPELLGLYDQGDKLSRSQTKHDVNHAFLVRDVAIKLTRMLAERGVPGPDALDEETVSVVIPLAAFLHDIGRAIDVDDHALAGARYLNAYLKKLNMPKHIIQRVCKVIACHRSEVVLKRDFDDLAWAIVVIADKAVGDEDRVRPRRAFALRTMRFFGLADRWPGSPHDRINFAIKSANLIVDGNDATDDPGEIVLKLRIDEAVADPKDIYELYGKRFHACGRAAQYLGYRFRLEFNGERYQYDKLSKTWVPVESISVLEE